MSPGDRLVRNPATGNVSPGSGIIDSNFYAAKYLSKQLQAVQPLLARMIGLDLFQF
jgi:hypothetical protein